MPDDVGTQLSFIGDVQVRMEAKLEALAFFQQDLAGVAKEIRQLLTQTPATQVRLEIPPEDVLSFMPPEVRLEVPPAQCSSQSSLQSVESASELPAARHKLCRPSSEGPEERKARPKLRSELRRVSNASEGVTALCRTSALSADAGGGSAFEEALTATEKSWGNITAMGEASFEAPDWPEQIDVHPLFRLDDGEMANNFTGALLICDEANSEDSEQEAAKVHNRFLLNPNGSFHVVKSILSMLLLLYELSLTPFILAWDMPLSMHLIVQSWVSAILWTLDILLTFRTGMYASGELVMNGKAIARLYLKTWFLPDLLVVSCDWMNVLLVAVTNESATGGLRIMRFTKLGRLVRIIGLIRMMRAVRLVEHFMDMNMPEECRLLVQLASLFATIMWVAHLVCCAWFAIGVGASDTGIRWIDSFSYLRDGEVVPFLEASLCYQYTTSFHFAAGQIALGTIEQMPTNSYERVFFVLAMMVGFLFGSTLISSLSAAMVDYQMMQKDKNQKLRTLRQYLLEKKVESGLAVPVQKQATERLAQRDKLLEKEVELLKTVSSNLRVQLHFAVQIAFLNQHPFLRLSIYLDFSLMQRLSFHGLFFQVWHTRDEIFVKYTQAKHAYLIIEGAITYRQDPALLTHGASPSTTSTSGKWLCEAALWCQWTHVGAAEASSTCELLAVDVDTFATGLQSSHILYSLACEYAKQFHRRLQASCPPLALWPTDLEVPCTDYCDLVVSMPREMQEVIGQAALSQLPKAAKKPGRSKLKEEVTKGTCILVTTGEGDVFRLVSLCALRIQRFDNRVFAQVGKWNGSEATPNCQLPGAKKLRDELNNQTVARIFKTKLPWLDGGVDMVDSTREITEKVSAEYGVRTRYLRTICTGTVRADYLLDAERANMVRANMSSSRMSTTRITQSVSMTRSHLISQNGEPMAAGRLEAILKEDVLVVWDGAKADLFAWLRENDFEFLSSSAGAGLLETWLCNISPQKMSPPFESEGSRTYTDIAEAPITATGDCDCQISHI